ncbi:Uncharacterised protein [Mycobacteroides abscessus subsp. abscessus]|nr:Uncharacterised protein [Mycobacteroides abscessus subsp. abscessus]
MLKNQVAVLLIMLLKFILKRLEKVVTQAILLKTHTWI